jgi:hypothetical protein
VGVVDQTKPPHPRRSSVYDKEIRKGLHSKNAQTVKRLQEGHDLIETFMRLKSLLGRTLEFVELYDAGFLQKEIDLLEFLLDDVQESIEDEELVISS